MALEDGLISVWHMNNNWQDGKGTNHGTAFGPTFSAATKKLGSHSGSFTVDDYTSIADADSLDLTTDITVGLWVYLSSLKNQFFLARNANGYGLGVYSTGLLTWGKIGIWEIQSVTALATGAWYHLVAHMTGGVAKIYINNSLDATSAGGRPSFDVLANDIYIGQYPGGGDYYLDGFLDEIGLWNRAITDAEITELWNGGNGTELNLPKTASVKSRMITGNKKLLQQNSSIITYVSAFMNTINQRR